MKYPSRKYRAGDADAINKLYFKITGRARTLEQHAWQWLDSPAGESEMWLIEADFPDGSSELIGHHGVMAELFTYRGLQVRVGKTENTMVLPEYRETILYPRYERFFLSQYENNFHALFSTMGPAPAIRLRQAMGYESRHSWVRFYVGREPFLSTHQITHKLLNLSAVCKVKLSSCHSARVDSALVSVLTDPAAEFDFDNFWQKASFNYPLTPSRTTANLRWRFWENPYRTHHTLKIDDPVRGIGMAVISTRSNSALYIDDLFCERSQDLGHFTVILHRWAARELKLRVCTSSTTSDCYDLFSSCNPKKSSWVQELFRKVGPGTFMPRKITPRGASVGLNLTEPWYVTPFYFEGR